MLDPTSTRFRIRRTFIRGFALAMVCWSLQASAALPPVEVAAYYRTRSEDTRRLAATQPARWEKFVRDRVSRLDKELLTDAPHAEQVMQRTIQFLNAYYSFAETGNAPPGLFKAFLEDKDHLGTASRAAAGIIAYAESGDSGCAIKAFRLNGSFFRIFLSVRDPEFERLLRDLVGEAMPALLDRQFHMPKQVDPSAAANAIALNYVLVLQAINKQGLPPPVDEWFMRFYRPLRENEFPCPDPLGAVVQTHDALGDKYATRLLNSLIEQGYVDDLLFEAEQNPRTSEFVTQRMNEWRGELLDRAATLKNRLNDLAAAKAASKPTSQTMTKESP